LRKFVINIIIYLSSITLLLSCSLLAIVIINDQKQIKSNNKNSIFLWGDSQAHQAINIEELSKSTKREIFSSAEHGNGVYDLMTFSYHVPRESQVILQISKPAQIRRLSRDRNASGLNWSSIKILSDNNYKKSDIFRIIIRNLFQNTRSNNYSGLHPYHEEIKFDSLEYNLISETYSRVPDYIFDKQAIIITAIDNLLQKNCEILMIELPYHPILKEIETNSVLGKITDSFKETLCERFHINSIDTVKILSEKNIFYDLTHFNKIGNKIITDYLSMKIRTLESTDFIVFE